MFVQGTDMDIKFQRRPSEYEQPRKSKKKKPIVEDNSVQKPKNNYDNPDFDYDTPDAEQGTPLGEASAIIPVVTSHVLKLPAEYDEVPTGSSPAKKHTSLLQEAVKEEEEEQKGSNHLFHGAMAFPSATTESTPALDTQDTSQPFGNHHPAKAKTLAPAHTDDYETPFDAKDKSKTAPGNLFGDFGNYETPLDASI